MTNTNDMREAFERAYARNFGGVASIFKSLRVENEYPQDSMADVDTSWIIWQAACEWQSKQVQGEPFAYCHLDVNGKAKELCSAPCADDDPRDTRTVQALYKHPPSPAAVPEVSDHNVRLISQSMDFLASAIKSGEAWSEQCQHIYDRAQNTLSEIAAPQPAETEENSR